MLKVLDFINFYDSIAPFETALEYDNVGLIVGDKNQTISSVLFCMDCTKSAVEFAIKNSCNLIISHHPLIFGGINNITSEDVNSKTIMMLIKNDISLISLHTNLDRAKEGIAYSLAKKLKLLRIATVKESPFIRIGYLPRPMSLKDFNEFVSINLNVNARAYGKEKTIEKLAVAPGAGSDDYIYAIKYGADAFLTGELKHHNIIECCAMGMCCIDAGHYASEMPGMIRLSKISKKQFKLSQVYIYTDSNFYNKGAIYG